MKKNPTVAAAKKARKAFKKELTEKITTQLTATIGDTVNSKKTTKIIAKAAKSLAKKIAKNTGKNKMVAETETAEPAVNNLQTIAQAKPVKVNIAPSKTALAKSSSAQTEQNV
ncbi:hypothetical protein [Mucilaginibacter auburnensis]|uniref:Uncharacterized protein n=1 Tax=Mucilaginibacter auburnensis TaxID=1457233 RepID=A0A2H9VVS1_9SPHI|nr:hypothetical protein [Mucilaginibacter auburnensis]PJJ84918.1 hypothetical protein CLV57_1940 [Mucilaginibacter auburnensis]